MLANQIENIKECAIDFIERVNAKKCKPNKRRPNTNRTTSDARDAGQEHRGC